MHLPLIDSIQAKIDAVRQRLHRVPSERIDIGLCAGRILAEPIEAFRDSPAVDVSAMDGYAARLCDVPRGPLPVVGVASAGAIPLECPEHTAVRIFTGGAVPRGADLVIPREQCIESPDRVQINVPAESLRIGQNIRYRGENASKGTLVLEPGRLLDGPALSSLVSLSEARPIQVHRAVRVAILNTGDELVEPGDSIEDWQIRDSNGPLLSALLSSHRWIHSRRSKVPDDPEQTRHALSQAFADSDAVILTGGVSMGDTDHVPKAIVDCGGEVIFHRVAIRPGKPLLGGVGPQGQLVMGLPGNPVSVAVTYRRYAWDLLRYIAGFRKAEVVTRVPVASSDNKRLDLLWFRLVALDAAGTATILPSQGSGDLVSLARSDGFVEIPPSAESKGSVPFFPWASSARI
ncbi:MAG: molybdopterin molybdotransferase MoeA [Planctomycetota bacterium]|jgi:molybdopterin molybdotransferase